MEQEDEKAQSECGKRSLRGYEAMKRTKALRIGAGFIKFGIFSAILAFLFSGAQQILKLNMGHRGTDNVNGFYAEKENSIEVLFIGASTMFCTADPLVLYEDYGIASYDFGSSAQPFELSYLFMQEALKTQKPKVIALEMLSIKDELDTKKADNLNYGLTDMPFSKEKAAAIYDMFRNDKGEGLSYLIPMAQYKDRWQELTKEDFEVNYVNYTKGAYTPDLISENPLDFSSYYEEEPFEISQRNLEIFDRMVTLCKENGIELLLFKSPNVGWNIGQTKAVAQLAEEYGLPFIDYYSLMEELEIDTAHDFRDNTHFNRYGSKKASDYMGQYLTEHYDLTDLRLTDSNHSWDIALSDRAHDRANEALGKTAGLPGYMSLIPYQGHTVAFCVTGDISGMEDFLRGVAAAFGVEEEKLRSGASFAVRDGLCISPLVGPGDESWQWEQGHDTMKLTGYSITYNREVQQLVDNGLTILVYDNDWQQLVDIVGFDASDPAHGVR